MKHNNSNSTNNNNINHNTNKNNKQHSIKTRKQGSRHRRIHGINQAWRGRKWHGKIHTGHSWWCSCPAGALALSPLSGHVEINLLDSGGGPVGFGRAVWSYRISILRRQRAVSASQVPVRVSSCGPKRLLVVMEHADNSSSTSCSQHKKIKKPLSYVSSQQWRRTKLFSFFRYAICMPSH